MNLNAIFKRNSKISVNAYELKNFLLARLKLRNYVVSKKSSLLF